MTERTCSFCGESFTGRGNRRFCFSSHEVPCDDCGETFIPNRRKLRERVKICSPCLRVRHSFRMKTLTATGEVGFGNPENQKAAKAGIRDKYGVENVSQVPEIRQRVKDTMLERYGAETSFGSEELRGKIAKTNLERYGAENPFASDSIKKAVKSRILETYGVENVTLDSKIRAKQLASMQERYGVNQPLENKAIAAVQRETLAERYGLDNAAKIPQVREKARKIRLKTSDEDFIEILTSLASESASGKISPQLLSENLSYKGYSPIYKRIRHLGLEELVQYGGESSVNQDWRHLLARELNVDFKKEGAIFSNRRWKVDLYHEESRVAVDVNPTISHSTQRAHPLYGVKKDNYHRLRALNAEANGWTLYQIYDWTPKEQVLSQLSELMGLNSREFNAEEALVVRPTRKAVKELLGTSILQKVDAVGTAFYGLEFSGELVQIMTFSKVAQRGAFAEYELSQLSSEGLIPGGALRLLNSFLTDYRPKTIRAYSSLDTGHGKVYESLGFRYHGLTELNGLYAKPGTAEVSEANSCYERVSEDPEATSLSQQDFMNSRGFYRIVDSGNKIFIWESKEGRG